MSQKGIRRKCNLEIHEIIELYQKGLSTSDIAKKSNVSSRYIRMILTKHNIKKRPQGSWKRKYCLNEDYFKYWSNNMAYILGFFVSEGFVARNSQMVNFAQKEKYILEAIKKELNSNQPIRKNKKSNVYNLNLHSKIMKADLMNIHSIFPNKSRDVKFPEVPDKYMNHFIRGYFDGDGHVNYKGYTVSFVGGSQHFMRSLFDILKRKGFNPFFTSNDKCYHVFITGRKTIKQFSDWIYRDMTLFLRRKYHIFSEETLKPHQLQDRKMKVNKSAINKRKEDFIRLYNTNLDVNATCSQIGIKYPTYNRWLKTDLKFNTKIKQIDQQPH